MNNSNNASDGNKFKDGLPEDVVQLYNKEEKEASGMFFMLNKLLLFYSLFRVHGRA